MITRNFSLDEFARVSHRALTQDEANLARHWWAPVVLQPMRNELGPIRITSYVRSIPGRIGGGTHRGGDAVDIVPVTATLQEAHNWLRARPWLFGQALLEPDHIHITRPGVNGKRGEVLIEVAPGEYRFGGAPVALLPVLILVGALLLVVAL